MGTGDPGAHGPGDRSGAILILGGMGFIALHTARRFLEAGQKVVITRHNTWRLPALLEARLGKSLFVEKLDVTNPHDFLALGRNHQVTGIVHMANPGLGEFAAPAARDFQINTAGLLNVLEFGKSWSVNRILLASSIAVYRGVPAGPFREDTHLPVESNTHIEAYKKVWENLGHFYGRQVGVDVVSVRIGSVFGPLFYQTAPQLFMRSVMLICQAAARGHPPELPPGGPQGEDATDLSYVRDIAEGVCRLQLSGSLRHKTYNLGAARVTSMAAVAAIAEQTTPDLSVELKPGRRGPERPNAFMDLSRIHEDTGFVPEWTLERALPEYIEWLRDNPE